MQTEQSRDEPTSFFLGGEKQLFPSLYQCSQHAVVLSAAATAAPPPDKKYEKHSRPINIK